MEKWDSIRPTSTKVQVQVAYQQSNIVTSKNQMYTAIFLKIVNIVPQNWIICLFYMVKNNPFQFFNKIGNQCFILLADVQIYDNKHLFNFRKDCNLLADVQIYDHKHSLNLRKDCYCVNDEKYKRNTTYFTYQLKIETHDEYWHNLKTTILN